MSLKKNLKDILFAAGLFYNFCIQLPAYNYIHGIKRTLGLDTSLKLSKKKIKKLKKAYKDDEETLGIIINQIQRKMLGLDAFQTIANKQKLTILAHDLSSPEIVRLSTKISNLDMNILEDVVGYWIKKTLSKMSILSNHTNTDFYISKLENLLDKYDNEILTQILSNGFSHKYEKEPYLGKDFQSNYIDLFLKERFGSIMERFKDEKQVLFKIIDDVNDFQFSKHDETYFRFYESDFIMKLVKEKKEFFLYKGYARIKELCKREDFNELLYKLLKRDRAQPDPFARHDKELVSKRVELGIFNDKDDFLEEWIKKRFDDERSQGVIIEKASHPLFEEDQRFDEKGPMPWQFSQEQMMVLKAGMEKRQANKKIENIFQNLRQNIGNIEKQLCNYDLETGTGLITLPYPFIKDCLDMMREWIEDGEGNYYGYVTEEVFEKEKSVEVNNNFIPWKRYNEKYKVKKETRKPIEFLDNLISFCKKRSERALYEGLYDYLMEIKASLAGIKIFNQISVVYQSENYIENIIGKSLTTGSCTEGPDGLFFEAALLGEMCSSVGKLYLKSYFNDNFQDNIGVAYVLKCCDNDANEVVWMIDGVETGIAVNLIKNQNKWKQTLYDGIYKAAEEAGVSRIIFNARVKNDRAKNFVRWLCKNKSIQKYRYVSGKEKVVNYINPKLVHSDKKKKIPRYSLTLCGSKKGVIESLAQFGKKYYAEAWYDADKSKKECGKFNCCDSEYLDRKVKGIEVRVK